jgi:EAL domain-containing protein (putative c-di-GMP-specific phosphodiesterase class I)
METTTEGVEHARQLDILREQGCKQIHGFYFSKPITEGQVAGWLQSAIRTEMLKAG